MEENDVKIYQSKSERIGMNVNLNSDFDSINAHRSNGNLEKAKQLGQRLATITPSLDGDGIIVNFKDILPQKYLSQDILFQIKVLMVFAAEAFLQVDVPVTILATTAINSLHDSLRKNSPGFHKNISDGTAFTFYYLAMKKGGDLSENMGEAFAMLCNVKNKEGYIEAGKTVWNIAVDVVENEIANADFNLNI